jgi:hypothetical protein
MVYKKMKILKSKVFHASTATAGNGIVIALVKFGVLASAGAVALPVSLVCGGVSLGLLIAFVAENKSLTKKQKKEFGDLISSAVKSGVVLPERSHEPFDEQEDDVEEGQFTTRTIEIDEQPYHVQIYK